MNINKEEIIQKVKDNGPTILTAIGLCGSFASTILAVKVTPKVYDLIDREAEIKRAPLTKKEVFKISWKPYLPAAIAFALSGVCIIYANSINTKRSAAAFAAYTLSEAALTEYKSKVISTIGKNKEKKIEDEIMQDRVANNPPNSTTVIHTKSGNTLVYDSLSDRYFRGSYDQIIAEINKINDELLHDVTGYITINEYYDRIKVDRVDRSIGDALGWNTLNLIEIDKSAVLSEDGEPAIAIYYRHRPNIEFRRF